MKRIIFPCILLLILTAHHSCTSKKECSYNLVSFNIRYDNPSDGINSWPNRKERVAALLQFHNADIACLQEALYYQIEYLEQQLPNFRWVGVGRDDGDKNGEFAAIFYNAEKFSVIETNNFWLSTTPNTPSIGWDAACIRICTYAKFKDKRTKKVFFVFNTHFDHVGVLAQQNSANLVIDRINAIAAGFPVVLTGDFNLLPESQPIQKISSILNDSWVVSKEPNYGPLGTWNGFDYSSDLKQRIDYIFVNEHFAVSKVAHLSDSKDKRFPSDHLPVFARLIL
jgi:endonuclease/exonuclease/phosphatase family metal-dependent hydrolase